MTNITVVDKQRKQKLVLVPEDGNLVECSTRRRAHARFADGRYVGT